MKIVIAVFFLGVFSAYSEEIWFNPTDVETWVQDENGEYNIYSTETTSEINVTYYGYVNIFVNIYDENGDFYSQHTHYAASYLHYISGTYPHFLDIDWFSSDGVSTEYSDVTINVFVATQEPAPTVHDLYQWSWTMDDTLNGAGDAIMSECTIYGGSGLMAMFTGQGEGDWTFSGSLAVERDVDDAPDHLFYSYYPDVAPLMGESAQLSFVDVGDTESGGDIFEIDATFQVEYDIYAIDPTDPPAPLGPSDPSPVVPGGDTSPTVAANYTDFRDAVESAMDNRGMSQEEIQTAMESALNNQGLDAENLKDAMSNALKENNQTQEGQYTAMRSALNAEGLSAEAIAGAVGDELNLDDNGYSLPSESLDSSVAAATNYGAVAGSDSIAAMSQSIETFTDGLDTPWFPTGLGMVSGVDLTLGGATVGLSFDHAMFDAMRSMLVWMVHVMGFMGAIKIVRSGIA